MRKWLRETCDVGALPLNLVCVDEWGSEPERRGRCCRAKVRHIIDKNSNVWYYIILWFIIPIAICFDANTHRIQSPAITLSSPGYQIRWKTADIAVRCENLSRATESHLVLKSIGLAKMTWMAEWSRG